MLYDQNWAVSEERVRAFFEAQEDVCVTADGYRYRNCLITISALPPNGQSIFSLPRTRLHIQGADDDAKAIYRRFFLRFLSAGG